MKYDQKQFTTLVNTLTVLNKYTDISKVNPSALHFLAFQQHSPGQLHNRLYYDAKTGTLKRYGNLPQNEAFQIITEVREDFQLYPEGCNDNHIETAVKAAIKQIV